MLTTKSSCPKWGIPMKNQKNKLTFKKNLNLQQGEHSCKILYFHYMYGRLTLCLLVSSTNIVCKQFRFRPGPDDLDLKYLPLNEFLIMFYFRRPKT